MPDDACDRGVTSQVRPVEGAGLAPYANSGRGILNTLPYRLYLVGFSFEVFGTLIQVRPRCDIAGRLSIKAI